MALQHGKSTHISINAVNLSTFTNASSLDQEADSLDTTCYGATAYTYAPGLLKASGTLSGNYDSAAGGPRLTIEPLIGTSTTLIRGVEGNGTGKPKQTATIVIKKYTETSPVAGYVSWSVDFDVTGPIATATF